MGASGGRAGASGAGGAGAPSCTGTDVFEAPDAHRCYRYVTDVPLDWDSALADCQAWGGSLAELTSADENAFVLAQVTTDVWLGATDRATEGTFEWVSGEPWLYEAWGAGEPNGSGNCLQVWYMAGAAWDDHPCTFQIPYLCERPAP